VGACHARPALLLQGAGGDPGRPGAQFEPLRCSGGAGRQPDAQLVGERRCAIQRGRRGVREIQQHTALPAPARQGREPGLSVHARRAGAGGSRCPVAVVTALVGPGALELRTRRPRTAAGPGGSRVRRELLGSAIRGAQLRDGYQRTLQRHLRAARTERPVAPGYQSARVAAAEHRRLPDHRRADRYGSTIQV
jgi:hypothetical protein